MNDKFNIYAVASSCNNAIMQSLMVIEMAEDVRISATKRSIARTLDQHDKTEYNELFDKVNVDIGCGRRTFDAALNQMEGANELKKERKPNSLRGRVYTLRKEGRTWLT